MLSRNRKDTFPRQCAGAAHRENQKHVAVLPGKRGKRSMPYCAAMNSGVGSVDTVE